MHRVLSFEILFCRKLFFGFSKGRPFQGPTLLEMILSIFDYANFYLNLDLLRQNTLPFYRTKANNFVMPCGGEFCSVMPESIPKSTYDPPSVEGVAFAFMTCICGQQDSAGDTKYSPESRRDM